MKTRGENAPAELSAGFEKAAAALHGKVRTLFGDRMKQAVCGAGPISADVLRFLYACGVSRSRAGG